MTSIEPDTSPSTAARAARTSLAALLATAVWLGIAFGLVRGQGCEGGMECLGDALLIIFGCLLAAAVTMWPLLVLFRVRPAWPVALVGPVVFVCFAVAVIHLEMAADWPGGWVLAILLAYAGAAVLVDRRANRGAKLVVLLIAAAALATRLR
ncbi:hypothetical protein [Catellatospora tritici]|uniref:hypothetical protein n=1 Tax=Catellatospora tritici TaxID=2851566 RepID=UPI001C2DC3F6|nr:hypothetical protein [Catellatospora tritici]MBV1850256.1 hypothetical protein [Catellatospora tritici]